MGAHTAIKGCRQEPPTCCRLIYITERKETEMNTYAISGITAEGLRRTLARNIREDGIEKAKDRLSSWGVTSMQVYPEAF